MTEPKSFESYRQLADDILTGKFCREDVPEIYKRDILARMLIDVYWEGFDDHARFIYGERSV